MWTRLGLGVYMGTLTGAFTSDKTFVLNNGLGTTVTNAFRHNIDSIRIITETNAGVLSDGLLVQNTIEIRIYE